DDDPDARHVALEPVALGGAAPVVALEDHVERHVVPRRELVGPGLGDGPVDDRQGTHDLEAFGERDHGSAPLGGERVLVRDDPGDEHVTALARVAEDVEVPDVEEVVDPWRIPDSLRHAIQFRVKSGNSDRAGRVITPLPAPRDPADVARGTTWAGRAA